MTDPGAGRPPRPPQRRPDRYVAGMTIAIAMAGLGLSAAFTYQATGDSKQVAGRPAAQPVPSGQNDDGGVPVPAGRPVAVSGGS